MGIIRNLEDLETWQRARGLAGKIYELTANFPGSEKHILVLQIKRVAVSVPANIAEGFGRYHAQESIQFYRNARGSLYELRSHFLSRF